MNLLEKAKRNKITQAPRRDQLKLDHMRNDINRAKIAPSKNISLMYCYNNNINNVVIMEKDKKTVSMLPKTRMNELRMGEKGISTTLNVINKKISMNQVKNVHSGYNKYWTYGGAIYGVKPGYIGRLDTGSTPSATNVYDVKGYSDLWYNMDIDVTNDRTHYEESGTDKQYKTVAPYTSWYGTDTYQLSDNLMYRSDKLSLSNMLRYNKVRSTYVNIPVNNRVETRYRYEDPPDTNTFNSLFPNPADSVTTTYETIYENQVITEKQTGKIPNPDNGTIEIQKTIQVPVQVPHEHRHHYIYRLENNGSYNYVVLYDYYLLDGVLQSTQTQVVKEYKTQVPYQITVAGSASPIMYGDYIYKHIYYTVRVRRERCVEDNGGGIGACHGYHWEYWYENVVVDRMDPQYIPGIIVPNNFKWVDIARYLYDNNKLVRGQYNVGGYSSYANIYNNTPYYATDVSENRRSTYHDGVRSLWNRSSSILFEKSYQVSDPPYPQPNLTFIGNLTDNTTHFNSLSEAKYA